MSLLRRLTGSGAPTPEGHSAHATPPEERAFAPHCDQRILHAPGECWACDMYPDWQALREKWGVAYTGQVPLTGVAGNQLPCPADFNRPPDSKYDHRRWGPNQAQGKRA